MTVAKLLKGRGPVAHVQPDDPVADVVAMLARQRIGCVPVVDGDRVVGLFSERDVIYGLAARGPAMMDMAVGEVMTSPPITITPSTGILEALALMTRRRIRHLPVVESERMVGFISIGDLVKSRIDSIEAEAEAMRDYIRSA